MSGNANTDTFTQLDEQGRARMVDVTDKAVTKRVAVAQGRVHLQPQTLRAIVKQTIPKGDVFAVARIAAISAAKKTGEMIPLCHPLPISHVDIDFSVDEATSSIIITSRVAVEAKTGVEMEALTSVAVAALTVYDMCKAVDKTMVISDLCLIQKTGGKSESA